MQAVSPQVEDRRFPPLASLFLVAAALWTCLWFVHSLGYWEDDAWIHLEFARSLARGHGFSFNGNIVYGDTSPLWVWLLVAVHAFVPDWLSAGKTLTALAAVFSLSGAYAFAERQTRSLGKAQSRLFAALMLVVFVTNPYFGYWAFSGMEALAAAGLVCWALVALPERVGKASVKLDRFLLTCFCAGIAPLLRPEMTLFTVLLGLVLFVRWTELQVRFKRKVGLFFAGFALIIGPGVAWAVYAARTFGSILPNTNAAKRAAPSAAVAPHLLGIYAFGFPLVLLCVVGLLGWLLFGRRRPNAVRLDQLVGAMNLGTWLLLVWTALNCVFYVVNHTYVQTRYIFVTAPVLTLALLAVARKLWPGAYRLGVVLGLIFGVSISALATWPHIRNKIQVDREYAALAAFLKTLPPRAPVAYYSIGEAAFLSEHPIIDTGGITRPGVIPYLFDADDRRIIWWAHEQGARYIVLDHQPEPGSTMVWDHTIPTTGWYLKPSRYRALESLRVWKLPTSPTLPLAPDLPAMDTQ